MKNPIFLIETNNQNAIEYFAIEASQVETMNVSDTYDSNGQRINAGDAGDYLTLNTEKAVIFANKVYNDNRCEYDDSEEVEKFKISDFVSACIYDEFNDIIKSTELTEGVDYVIERETCEGFNYWDGNNWKTIELANDNNEYFKYEVLKDKALIKKLKTAITRKQWQSKGAGYEYYRYGSIGITESFWQGVWYEYSLKEIEIRNFRD